MIKNKMNDTQNVLKQYQDGKNLTTRVSLYEKYSLNDTTYPEWIHQYYHFFEGCQILEFGTGTGKDWRDHVAGLPPNATLTLSDFSSGMVEALKVNFSANRNVEIRALDIQNTPLEDKSKDFIIANSMLYHVPDLYKAIGEVSRILKSDGTFYAATAGNKNMFQFLRETYLKTNSRITLPKSIPFTLENGSEYLEKHFKHVEIARYINRLEVTDTSDLVDYYFSFASIEGLEEGDRPHMLAYFEEQKNSRGAIPIEIEYGMFIAKGPSAV